MRVSLSGGEWDCTRGDCHSSLACSKWSSQPLTSACVLQVHGSTVTLPLRFNTHMTDGGAHRVQHSQPVHSLLLANTGTAVICILPFLVFLLFKPSNCSTAIRKKEHFSFFAGAKMLPEDLMMWLVRLDSTHFVYKEKKDGGPLTQPWGAPVNQATTFWQRPINLFFFLFLTKKKTLVPPNDNKRIDAEVRQLS